MNVFLDTNIALDYILERKEFVENAKSVIAYCLNCKHTLYLSSVSFANISYIARKGFGGLDTRQLLILLRRMVRVTVSNEDVVDRSLLVETRDFEDAMQYYSASTVDADVIVTRNVQDFPSGSIRVMTPKEFLESVRV